MLADPLDLLLPWSVSDADDKRFSRLLGYCFVVFMLIAIVVPLLPLEEVTRQQQEALPPQLARIIMEKKQLPLPPPPTIVKTKKKPEIKKEKLVEETKPLPKPVVDKIQQAKDEAAISGLLAFQDDLSEMRDSLDVDSLSAVPVSNGDQQAVAVERSVIAGKVTEGSGGIAVSKLSNNVGGGALAGKTTTQVANADKSLTSKVSQATAKPVGRSDDAIRRVMDRNKAPIFSIYNRALRKDPSLQGQFVFEMVISPSGQVTRVRLISSALNDSALDNKILSRIRLINFGAAKVMETKVNYSFDFVPY